LQALRHCRHLSLSLRPRTHDEKRQPVERLPMVRLKRLNGGRIAVVAGFDPAGALHLETHKIIGERSQVSVLVLNPNGYKGEVLPVGVDLRPIRNQTQSGRLPLKTRGIPIG
jgi:hypothetical protein